MARAGLEHLTHGSRLARSVDADAILRQEGTRMTSVPGLVATGTALVTMCISASHRPSSQHSVSCPTDER